MPYGQAVFIPGSSLRPLVVLIDHHLTEQTADRKIALLLELLAVQPVRTHLHSDTGAPATAPRIQKDRLDFAAGWAELHSHEDGRFEVTWVRDGEPMARPRSRDQLESRIGGWMAGTRAGDSGSVLNESDARVLLVAEAIQADLLITDRPALLSAAPDPWMRATVMTPAAALPNVGLYLRRQGQLVRRHRPRIGELRPQPDHSAENASTFYWDAAQSLLPFLSAWSRVCTDYDEGHGTDAYGLLAEGLPLRLGQVLQCRDRLLAALARPPSIAVMDEALSELDQLLLLLMSAFDITARVANDVLGIRMDRHGVGWQQGRWLKLVKDAYRPLYDAATSRAFKGVPALVFIISKLRNMVHGPGLVPGGTIPEVGEHPLEIFAALPNEDARQIEEALVRVATGIDWGLRNPHEGSGLHFQPGTFAERVLTFALPLLNELMQNTVPLKHAEAERKPLAPDEPITPFDARRLWQLGIEPVSRVSDF